MYEPKHIKGVKLRGDETFGEVDDSQLQDFLNSSSFAKKLL